MRIACCIAAFLLAGCQSLTGLAGSSPNFACKAPDGVACTSVSGVHANLMAGNLPFQRGGSTPTLTPSPVGLPLAMPAAGDPLRREERILRIWLAPWVDSEETLHDQSFLYAQVDPGRWQIGEIRRRVNTPTLRRGEVKAIADASARPSDPVAAQHAQKPLADVRADAQAQAAARAAVQAAQRQGERP